MKRKILITFFTFLSFWGYTQNDSVKTKKERLDFARTYFEIGGTFLPSFTGKRLVNNVVSDFKNPASVIQYFTWGGFHFWGHTELYVNIPLAYKPFKNNNEASSEILHSVTTGARFLPWAYKEKKLRPYIGICWSALDFRQKIKDANPPMQSKDIMLTYDTGLLFGYRNFSLRLALNYFHDNKWEYPLSRTLKADIKTPTLGFQVGLLYSMDFSKRTDKETIDKWNSYPSLSRQSLGSTKFGDVFIGIGPSLSYTLYKSEYNQNNLPYLKSRLTSSSYFDIALGYHFQRAGLFTALSFRNPRYETEGYGAKQTIRKTSLAFEINKYIIDYTGFTPFVGINVAYDKLKYTENIAGNSRTLSFDNQLEPGITFGWDIQPGKNQEALILRTNLRWYPFSSFRVDGKNFNFNQLEYNLIQAVLYPERLKKKNNRIT
ncbi:MAG: hypothetical protein NVV82_29565 [Sporocytophaga sp.]|nr:hypothetical protein [Sporocytophaga sp.]